MKILGLFFIIPFLAHAAPDAIYGRNDIKPVTSLSDKKILELSKSIAVRIPKNKKRIFSRFKKISMDISEIPYYEKRRFSRPGEKSKEKLCKSVPYYGQKRIEGACAAFLVGEDKLLTTLHCLEGEGTTEEQTLLMGCRNFSWMFGYRSSKRKKENIFHCERVLAHKGSFHSTDYFEDDYVLIQLNKKTNRPVLKISKKENVKEVFMVGFPMGLPMRVSTKGEVLDFLGQFYFSNLDAFEGSSGSPVFDAKTYELIGIMNSGKEDYVHNGRCVELKKYDNSEGTEAFYALKNLTLDLQ